MVVFLRHNYLFQFSIRITGVTGVEIMAGLHWYLKYWCGSHISWDKTGGAQLLSVPDSGSFPHVQEAGILIQRPIPWNYYQNAVTSSCELLPPNHLLFPNLCQTEIYVIYFGAWGLKFELRSDGHCLLSFICAFWRYFCLVGLEKMGKGNWLDGSPRHQFASGIYRARGHLAESFPGIFVFVHFSEFSLWVQMCQTLLNNLLFIFSQNFNISHLDLKDFFGGPAFLSWSRMGNLHGWEIFLMLSRIRHQQFRLEWPLCLMFNKIKLTPQGIFLMFSGKSFSTFVLEVQSHWLRILIS